MWSVHPHDKQRWDCPIIEKILQKFRKDIEKRKYEIPPSLSLSTVAFSVDVILSWTVRSI